MCHVTSTNVLLVVFVRHSLFIGRRDNANGLILVRTLVLTNSAFLQSAWLTRRGEKTTAREDDHVETNGGILSRSRFWLVLPLFFLRLDHENLPSKIAERGAVDSSQKMTASDLHLAP